MSRHTPTPGWLIHRFRRGWNVTQHEARTLPRIAEWTWPFRHEAPQPIPVHVLTGERHWRLTAWMLASFFHFSELTWPIVIHDDGTLPEDAQGTFKKMFGHVRIIMRAEADAALAPVLRAYPFCADYRQNHPTARKLFDIPHFARGGRFFIFDSDLLFFSHPREVVDWAAGTTHGCWFLEDAKESALVTAAEARAELGVKLWSRVDTGLCLATKLMIDLDLCDRALAQTSIPSGSSSRIVQTLLMLCAARQGAGGLLPRKYEVSPGRDAAPDAVARHYTGAARDRFFGEGLPRLRDIFFPKEP